MSDSFARSRCDAAATRPWVDRLERFAASNQTVATFCAAEGIAKSNFFRWKRRLMSSPTPAPNQSTVVPIRGTRPADHVIDM